MRVVNLEKKKLELTNEGELSIFFIGSGSAFSKTMNQTNILIVKGDDHLLVDCGTKTPQALWEYGQPVYNIDNFYITHTHADHIGGLEEVMLMNRYMMNGKKANIHINRRFKNQLWNHSLRGGTAGNEAHKGKQLAFEDLWTVVEPRKVRGALRDSWKFQIGDLKLTAFRTMHTPDNSVSWKDSAWSTGLLIDDRILFSSDTRFDKDMIDFAESLTPIECIFHDCQFFPGGVHASLDELDTLPINIREKIYLMHYGDNWEKFESRIEESDYLGFVRQGNHYIF